jgi:hypothetical protein
MAQTLTALGTISYNGFTIGGPRVKTSLRCRPKYDSAGRTNIYNVYEILVTWILTSDAAGLGGGADTGTNMLSVMSLLSQPGGPLIFNGLGYGGIQINTITNASDVLYGPKPQLIVAEPVGANLAMRLTWTCEVAIAQCPSSNNFKGVLGQLVELVYTSDWTIDSQGLTTVVVRGHDTIALNRNFAGGSTIAFTADQNRQQLSPNPPLGMRLESQKWTLSEDKSRDDFAFIYKELANDNALPAGCSDIEMRHLTRNQLHAGSPAAPAGGFATAVCTITGFVETIKPYPPAYGYEKAIQIITERLTNARNNGAEIFITELSVDEPILGNRKLNFSLSYYIVHTSLTKFTTDAGMFRPVTVTDWNSWKNSMMDTAWSPTGWYGLQFDPGTDIIVDHCNQAFPPSSNPDNVIQGTYVDPGSFSNDTSQSGYLHWEHTIGVDTHSNSVDHYPLPTSPPSQSGGSQNAPNSYGTPSAQFTPPMDNTQPAAVRQIMGQKPVRVILHGSGVRQNQPVEIPTVNNAFGTTTGYNSRQSSINHTAYQNIFGATLYAANWYLVYDVALTPDQIGQVITGDISQLVVGTPNDPTNKT